MKMFKTIHLLIKVYSNRIELINLDNEKTFTKTSEKPFSSSRLIIADFHEAKFFFKDVVKEVFAMEGIRFLAPKIKAAFQVMELYEGGLSEVEMRAFKDIAELSGIYKVLITDGSKQFSNKYALEMLKKN